MNTEVYDTKGKIDELKSRIIAIKMDELNPPKLKKDMCCSVQEVNNLIGSMVSMIASIMCRDVADDAIYEVDREIRLFLSNLGTFEKCVVILHDESIT